MHVMLDVLNVGPLYKQMIRNHLAVLTSSVPFCKKKVGCELAIRLDTHEAKVKELRKMVRILKKPNTH